jgi:hypothetical protein
METYPAPEFLPSHPYGYVYAGYRVAAPRQAPFVRPSRERDAAAANLRATCQELAARQDVVSATLFRAVLMPPIPGAPRHDLLLLVRTEGPGSEVLDALANREPEPAVAFAATNTHRIGDTDARAHGTFLFNHFTGSEPGAAASTWKDLTGWYTAKTGVDNSTLLTPEQPAPFAIVNYVRLPRGPLAFMLDQLRRPSFHTVVRRRLRRAGLRALPVCYTRV